MGFVRAVRLASGNALAIGAAMLLASCGPSTRSESDGLGSNRAASLDPVNTGLAALASDAPLTPAADAPPLIDPSAQASLPPASNPIPTPPPSTDEDKLAASQAAAASLQAALNEPANQIPTDPVYARPPQPPAVAVEPVVNEQPKSRVATITKNGNKRPNTTPAAPAGPAMATPGPVDTNAIAPAVESATQAWSTARTTPPPISQSPSTTPTTLPTISAGGTNARQAAAPSSPADPLVSLAQQMASLIRNPASDPSKDPTAIDAAALAPIEAMHPGALTDLDSPNSPLFRLPPQDRATLAAARDRLAASGANSSSEPLRRSLSKITPAATLRIPRTALCSRVESFGKFTTLPGDTFIAGRPIRAIVYTELDGFAARPAREGDRISAGTSLADQVSVDLQQSLALYQDATGVQVWTRPPQSVVETSRTKRRDFYLIQQIELPKTLGVGKYNLKVTVKDRNSGAESEAIVPVTIIAQ